jgi:hypothetical protein
MSSHRSAAKDTTLTLRVRYTVFLRMKTCYTPLQTTAREVTHDPSGWHAYVVSDMPDEAVQPASHVTVQVAG